MRFKVEIPRMSRRSDPAELNIVVWVITWFRVQFGINKQGLIFFTDLQFVVLEKINIMKYVKKIRDSLS